MKKQSKQSFNFRNMDQAQVLTWIISLGFDNLHHLVDKYLKKGLDFKTGIVAVFEKSAVNGRPQVHMHPNYSHEADLNIPLVVFGICANTLLDTLGMDQKSADAHIAQFIKLNANINGPQQ